MKATANYVDINGNQVIDLTPDYNRPLALVDLTVLNTLTALLPKADFGNIRHGFRERIMSTNNLEELVQASEDFISFHRSVNLIREICQGEINMMEDEPRVKVVGRINLDDIDTCGRDHAEY
jgi:hypothetical protein